MVAAHPPKAVLQDIREVKFGGTVVERGRRLYWFEVEVHRHAVALLCPDQDARAVEGEALFVVASNDVIELFPTYRKPPAGGRREQRIHRHPAAGTEFKPESLRLVTQILAQVFAQAHESPISFATHDSMLA